MTRTKPPYAADEREMLIAHLDFERESVVMKLDGLTEAEGRHRLRTTSNSLMGLTQHLGWMEVWWFQVNFLGEKPDLPWKDADMDSDFRIVRGTTISDVVVFYRREWERSNEIARAALSLDQEAAYSERKDGVPTLRWILNHMLEETARHAGHADITRELIDGATGL